MPAPGGRFHWPDQSGYFDSSWACAPTSAIASVAKTVMATAAIGLRLSMVVLRADVGTQPMQLLAEIADCRERQILTPLGESEQPVAIDPGAGSNYHMAMTGVTRPIVSAQAIAPAQNSAN